MCLTSASSPRTRGPITTGLKLLRDTHRTASFKRPTRSMGPCCTSSVNPPPGVRRDDTDVFARGAKQSIFDLAMRNDAPEFVARSQNLQRRKHSVADIGGTVTATEFRRLDSVGISLIDGALDPLAGF